MCDQSLDIFDGTMTKFGHSRRDNDETLVRNALFWSMFRLHSADESPNSSDLPSYTVIQRMRVLCQYSNYRSSATAQAYGLLWLALKRWLGVIWPC
jgi:hypothetical protein